MSTSTPSSSTADRGADKSASLVIPSSSTPTTITTPSSSSSSSSSTTTATTTATATTLHVNLPQIATTSSSTTSQVNSTPSTTQSKKQKQRDTWKNKNNEKKQRRNNNPAPKDYSKFGNNGSSSSGGGGGGRERGDGDDDNEHLNEVRHPGSHASDPDIQILREELALKNSLPSTETTGKASEGKLPKRKLGVLLAYTGKNYSGLQMNPGAHTIQGELEKSFYLSKMITLENYGFPQKQQWSNSARTDKGVHAAAMFVSLRCCIPTTNEDLDVLRDTINSHLPEDIRVLDLTRTTKSFCAKTNRDKVRYLYVFPSYLIQTSDVLRGQFEGVINKDGKVKAEPFIDLKMYAEKLNETFIPHRIDASTLTKVKEAFKKYIGTLKYHNYTSQKNWSDPSVKRYMTSFKPIDLNSGLMYGSDGMEYVAVEVVGQSFLYNQIRKMVSMALEVIRGKATEGQMEGSFDDGSVKINIAPSQGLFLDMSYFTIYSAKNANSTNEPLVYDGTEKVKEDAVKRWAEFRESHIVAHILKEESVELNFMNYIYNMEYGYNMKYEFVSPEDLQKNFEGKGGVSTSGTGMWKGHGKGEEIGERIKRGKGEGGSEGVEEGVEVDIGEEESD